MALKLTSRQIAARERHQEELREASQALETALSDFNEQLLALRKPVEQAITKYNKVLDKARQFTANIATSADNYVQQRQALMDADEDIAGDADHYIQQYSLWAEEAKEVTIRLPEEVEVINPADCLTALDNLPDSATDEE